MLRSINIKEEVSIHLQVITDMSYAWHIMDAYTTYMQKGIKEDPSLVVKLRATFLKVNRRKTKICKNEGIVRQLERFVFRWLQRWKFLC